ncbi:MAG TPA: protease modulator HflC [Verrucomicrobiae bacterium]|nr:protease modulator HflC [Verrucomicrobiae bacterium]
MNPTIQRLVTMAASFIAAIVLLLALKAAVGTAFYTVGPQETILLTQFGKIVGQPVTQPGLHMKTPFIQTVHRLDRRIQEWDGQAVPMPTGDKLYTLVDSFGRWRISDPILYYTRMRDTRSALSRMDDIIGSEVRNAVAKHDLIEIVRTDKNRKPAIDQNIEVGGPTNDLGKSQVITGKLPPIRIGRTGVELEALTNAQPKLAEVGIDLLDVRMMRLNYNSSVSDQIKSRMTSERKQIADRYRAEGEGRAAEIMGNKERDLQEITSGAYKTAQAIRGEADARATEIYAQAYNQSPQSAELYAFLKTLETYRRSVTNSTTLVLTTDSELFRGFKTSLPKSAPH